MMKREKNGRIKDVKIDETFSRLRFLIGMVVSISRMHIFCLAKYSEFRSYCYGELLEEGKYTKKVEVRGGDLVGGSSWFGDDTGKFVDLPLGTAEGSESFLS